MNPFVQVILGWFTAAALCLAGLVLRTVLIERRDGFAFEADPDDVYDGELDQEPWLSWESEMAR